MPASPAATAARVPMSEEELDVHREMELDRQLTGTTRRFCSNSEPTSRACHEPIATAM